MLALSAAHGAGTLVDALRPTFFTPVDAAVREAMAATPVTVGAMLAGSGMTMWRGHLGWNLSIGIGGVFAGALQLRLARLHPQGVPRPLALLGAGLALALGIIGTLFWFWIPAAGFLVAAACLALGAGPDRPPAASARFALGVLPMAAAGGFHLLATFPEPFVAGVFSPLDRAVRPAMAATEIALPRMLGSHRAMWDAYVGFNFAHGAVVVAFALGAFLVARHDASEDRVVRLLFAAATCCWLAVALLYWFWGPAAAVAASAAFYLTRWAAPAASAAPTRS